jgi:transketolase
MVEKSRLIVTKQNSIERNIGTMNYTPGKSQIDITGLERKAKQIRNMILQMCISTGGHIVSSLSFVDILVTLYYGGNLNIDSSHPDLEDRDRFFLSKGHGEAALYAVLADLGFFPISWLDTQYRKGDCYLGGHPDRKIPGVEITSGSLGHGLGLATGTSLAAKMDNKAHLQFVLMGDAECTEGSIWEAALFASKHKLDNLIAIVDRNRIGSIDFTNKFTSLEPFCEKWKSFGWETIVCDGHDCKQLHEAFQYARIRDISQPLIIIAETIKGKGIPFMENDPTWHVRSLSKEDDIKRAIAALQ